VIELFVFPLHLNLVIAGLWLDSTSVPTLQEDGDHLRGPQELATTWSLLFPDFPANHVHTLASIDQAVNLIRGLSYDNPPINVLVTGSFYLVAGVMKVAGLSDTAV
jgi:folylpolyglutamate synthase